MSVIYERKWKVSIGKDPVVVVLLLLPVGERKRIPMLAFSRLTLAHPLPGEGAEEAIWMLLELMEGAVSSEEIAVVVGKNRSLWIYPPPPLWMKKTFMRMSKKNKR